MTRQTLLEEFKILVKSVRSREFPYRAKRAERICWSDYDTAQRNEYPDVIRLIARTVDAASSGTGFEPVRLDALGRESCFRPDLVKVMLAQQYDGRCNRVSMGYVSLMADHLGIEDLDCSYKTLERSYDDPDVMALLNDIFFITQLPVRDLEHSFAIDGTCHPTTIKQNWESTKDQILKLNAKGKKKSKKRKGSKQKRKRREFEKTILAAGTTFKIISSFAIAKTPFANESPYLKPLFNQIAEFYAYVKRVCADSAFLSRENCTILEKHGAIPRIFPKVSVSPKAKGSQAWKRMLTEFVDDTQTWLENYHPRSIMETINSTLKRTQPTPIRKKLVIRKATEILARICVYNIRQLVYLKYTRGIDLSKIRSIERPPTLLNYIQP